MQTRSFLQRSANSESSDRVVAHIKPRSWGDEIHKQPQTVHPQNTGFDFKNADWFSHDPGPRSPVRVFNSIQAKLTVGAPNDVYEQEADRVAEQVMSTPDSAIQQPIQREAMLEEKEELQTKPLAATITPLVQREEIPQEEKEEELQTKPLGNSIQREEMPEEEKEEEEIQTKRSPDASFQAGSNLESRLSNSQGGGSPLSEEVRSFMEPRFGADFSHVRVHNGSEAVQMNQDLSAQAFTHKQDVYFGVGKSPGKDALTAHELTHVVQQTGEIQRKCGACEAGGKEGKELSRIQTKLSTSHAEDQDEPEARQISDTVTSIYKSEVAARLVPEVRDNVSQLQQSSYQGSYVQRVHIENGRKKFDSPDFQGDSKLEACLNDEDRLRPHETGSSVIRVQQGLQKDGADLGKDGTRGIYGADTGKAVMAFKRKHHLGFETFPDVGPGTMKKLDELSVPTPVLPKPTPLPKPPRPAAVCKTPTNSDLSSTTFNPTTIGENAVAARAVALGLGINVVRARIDASTALSAAEASVLLGIALGPADAFRHCLWNCLMTQHIGAIQAEQFATGHENSGPSSIPFDNQMDLHDNATGRKLGIAGADCQDACMGAVTSGQLRTIRQPPLVPTDCIGASDQSWP